MYTEQTHHITTILNSVKVVPSESNASIPTPPIRTGPPFIVIGVADRPFLAKIELSFSGTSSALDQKLIFQHWVDVRLCVVCHRDPLAQIMFNSVVSCPSFLYSSTRRNERRRSGHRH